MTEQSHTKRRLVPILGTKVAVFDASAGYGKITNIANLTDVSVAKRGNQWWMFGAGLFIGAKFAINLMSASLPPGAQLSAEGWSITTKSDNPAQAEELIPSSPDGTWDAGRHCPSYVRGWDPTANNGNGAWCERLYYTGTPAAFTGPYANGFAEWDGERWIPQQNPVLSATEPWEHGNVAEPNVIYSAGKWHMWYSAGPDSSMKYAQGYAVSANGKTNWERKLFSPASEEIFDHPVITSNGGVEAVFARYPLLSRSDFEPQDGLWWYYASHSYDDRARWSAPQQLISDTTDVASWHAGGVWKPGFQYSDKDPTRMFVFFDAASGRMTAGKRPVLSVGCIECQFTE